MTMPATLPARDALMAEANHRIGNNLALIAALVRRHARSFSARQRPTTSEEVLALLGEVEASLEAVGRLHRLLAEIELGAAVDLGDYLRDVAEAAVSALSGASPASLSHTSAASCAVPANQALPIGLIVGELVTNALKYAHPAGVAGKISVGCRRTVEEMILVEVADDGVGLPEGFNPMTQGDLGLLLVRSLAKRLGAKPIFECRGIGLRVRLLVPTARPVLDEIDEAQTRPRHRIAE